MIKVLICQHIIQRIEVKTTSEATHTKGMGNEEVLKKENMKNTSDNTKDYDSVNSKRKLRYFKYKKETLLNNRLQ